MNSSDDYQLHSSVGFKVHRSKALSEVSLEQQRMKFQPSLISKKQAKVSLCCSDDHCGREPQRGEKSFCIKAGFVSRIVACFSQFLTERLHSSVRRYAGLFALDTVMAMTGIQLC